MKTVDLHTHSNISDGSCSPSEVVEAAARAGLAALALTDHETIAGTAEAKARAMELGIECISGMEMTVEFQGRRLHIVALGFDENHAEFQKAYKRIRQSKEERMEEVIEAIQKQGVDISPEILRPFVKFDQVDRYAIMRYFVSLGRFDNVQKIWDLHINPALAGINWNIPAAEGLAAIRAAGGVSSLAHYHKRIGLKGLTKAEHERAIAALVEMGLDGMEQYYPNFSDEEQAFASYLIDTFKLLPTGGSDFHGKNRPDVEIGSGVNGNIAVPYALYEDVVRRSAHR